MKKNKIEDLSRYRLYPHREAPDLYKALAIIASLPKKDWAKAFEEVSEQGQNNGSKHK